MLSEILKVNPLYRRARAAAFSLNGQDRFYNPLSAALQFDAGRGHTYDRIKREVLPIRSEDGLAIWQTPSGELATIKTEIAEHVAFLLTEFETDVYSSSRVPLNPGAIVLDVGANIGLFTKRALKLGAERVIALEPAPETFLALSWNLRSDVGKKLVSLVNKGAWNAADKLRFTVDPKRPARSSITDAPPEKTAYEVTIEVERIDRVVQDLMLPRVDFIKMDIEGAEVKALQGAEETLRRYNPMLAIAVEHTEDPLENAKRVRDLVLGINPRYHCSPGPYMLNGARNLVPEILFFSCKP